jgi:3D-(3,5/4)-trihydroxycyclohexane-1,2-dione acylhydrolase (decyclizing)
MSPGEVTTAVAERIPFVIVLVDNHGYASIGALSRSVGGAGFGTHYRPARNGSLPVDAPDGAGPAEPLGKLPVDLAANLESLGVPVIRARTIAELRAGLEHAREGGVPIAVHVEVDRYAGVPAFEGWWDVPVAEVSESESVRAARAEYERDRAAQRAYLG